MRLLCRVGELLVGDVRDVLEGEPARERAPLGRPTHLKLDLTIGCAPDVEHLGDIVLISLAVGACTDEQASRARREHGLITRPGLKGLTARADRIKPLESLDEPHLL